MSLTISSFVIGAAGARARSTVQGFAPGASRFRLEDSRRAGRDMVLLYERERGGNGGPPGGGLD